MTEERHCYENWAAERVNGILKLEFALDRRFATVEEARRAITEAVESYNTKRPHEMLGSKPRRFRVKTPEGRVKPPGGSR